MDPSLKDNPTDDGLPAELPTFVKDLMQKHREETEQFIQLQIKELSGFIQRRPHNATLMESISCLWDALRRKDDEIVEEYATFHQLQEILRKMVEKRDEWKSTVQHHISTMILLRESIPPEVDDTGSSSTPAAEAAITSPFRGCGDGIPRLRAARGCLLFGTSGESRATPRARLLSHSTGVNHEPELPLGRVSEGCVATAQTRLWSPCMAADPEYQPLPSGANGEHGTTARLCLRARHVATDPESHGDAPKAKRIKASVTCKCCREPGAYVMDLPCQHLCVSKPCEASLSACPVCSSAKKAAWGSRWLVALAEMDMWKGTDGNYKKYPTSFRPALRCGW